MTNPDNFPPFLLVALEWLKAQPVLAALLIAMGIDQLSGIAKAISQKKLNSNISWTGGMKKAMVILIVGLARTIEPFAGGLSLAHLSALFFLYHEGLSILENASALGLPLPEILKSALVKGMVAASSSTTTVTAGPGSTVTTSTQNAPTNPVQTSGQTPSL